MSDQPLNPEESSQDDKQPTVRSFKELLDIVSGRTFEDNQPQEDLGLAESLPFPFLALVGQSDMKIALSIALINPAAGGVLLIGPRGTGKTTAVRSLLDLLPQVERSTCPYGCLPQDIEAGGLDAVCPDCAHKFGMGEPLSHLEKVRLVELPLNARMEDVIGGLDERAAVHNRMRLKPGILSNADLNILYVDEVNLLADEIVDAILDAAAAGAYTVRRGPMSATYRARFTLIGSMNPEEGHLRPQILDRFGLRVLVTGLSEPNERLEAYRRVRAYLNNPRSFIAQYVEDMALAQSEIEAARRLLPKVALSPECARVGIHLIQQLKIESLRAEITLFEAARALAAADGRTEVSIEDLQVVAPLALRLRRSDFISRYFEHQKSEDEEVQEILKGLLFGKDEEA